jgi:hypothetical protein
VVVVVVFYIEITKVLQIKLETSYKSDNYGDFIIKKDKKSWIITWDYCDDGEYITIDSTDDLNDYVQDDDECEKVTKSFPKKGVFRLYWSKKIITPERK